MVLGRVPVVSWEGAIRVPDGSWEGAIGVPDVFREGARWFLGGCL